jgi:hypothetical protein
MDAAGPGSSLRISVATTRLVWAGFITSERSTGAACLTHMPTVTSYQF